MIISKVDTPSLTEERFTMSENNALALLSTNVNVGMNEVVSVFVARYEDQLFTKKDELSKKIKQLKQQLSNLIEHVKETVDVSSFNCELLVLGLKFEVKELRPDFDDRNYRGLKNHVLVSIVVSDIVPQHDNCKTSDTIYRNLPIPEEIVNQKTKLDEDIATASNELTEIMTLIASVGRKERQIRGKISEMKLTESGMADLINNQELGQLIMLN